MKSEFLRDLVLPICLMAVFAGSAWAAEKPTPVRVDGVEPPPKYVGRSSVLGIEGAQPDCEDINPDPEVVVIHHGQFGVTYYDYQRNGSMGRMIAVGPEGHVHTTYHRTDGPYSEEYPRYVDYNCKDPVSGWIGANSIDGGTDVNAGYANIDVLHDGRCVVIYHTTAETPEAASVLKVQDEGSVCSPSFSNRYDLPDWLQASDEGEWPKMGIVYDEMADTDYIHIVMTEGKTDGGDRRLGYIRCHLIEGDSLLCHTPIGQAGVTSPTVVAPNVPGCSMLCPIAYFGECEATGVPPGEYPNTISAVVAASPVSPKVAVVFINKREAGDNSRNSDVFYFESTDNGMEWFPQFGGTWPPMIANGMLVNVTNYPTEGTERAYADLAACYDYNDSLHIVWNGCYYDSATGDWSGSKANLYHWSKLDGISLIASAQWENTDPGDLNRNICKMSISAKDPVYHAGGEPDSVFLFCTWTQFNEGDMSAAGMSNGDIYIAASSDAGATWTPSYNLTNTQTPDCEPGECLSEHWSSLAENLYDGEVHVAYVCDRDAGGIVQDEGTWTENPMMYMHVAQVPHLGCCQLGSATCAVTTQTECEAMAGVFYSDGECNQETGLCELPECVWVPFDDYSLPLTPPDVEVLDCEDPSQTVLQITIHGMCLQDITVDTSTFQLVTVPEMTSTGEFGRPQLPALGEIIGLPTVADTVTVESVITSDSLIFPNLHVFPLQRQPKSEYEPAFVMDTNFYADSDSFYPGSKAETGPVNFWHVLRTSNVGIFPFQYNPKNDTLIVHPSLYVTLRHDGPPVTDTVSRSYSVIYQALANYECLPGCLWGAWRFNARKLFVMKEALGNDSCIAKLMRYEKRKGFYVKKHTIEAGENRWAIKDSIKAFYFDQPPLPPWPGEVYVVLIGDRKDVKPAVETFGFTEEILDPDGDVLSDEWYAFMQEEDDEDHLPDLFLGRFPTSSPATLCEVINMRIRNDTLAADHITKELLVAHKERRSDDNRIEDPGDGRPREYFYRESKKLIKATLTNPDCGFSVKEVYGSDRTKNNAHVRDAINAGLGQVNYNGHGTATEWQEWSKDPDHPSWTKDNVDALDVNGKEPIVWSMACYNNRLDNPDFGGAECIGKEWINKCKATAHFGSSGGSCAKQSNYLDKFIHEALCKFAKENRTVNLGQIVNYAKGKLGGKFFCGKEEDGQYAGLTIMEYLLLGDPAQTVWTKASRQPVVEHDSVIPAGYQEFTVTVKHQGNAVEGAIVSLWKEGPEGDEVFEALYTDDSGHATFYISPWTFGWMYVTVWGKNLKVYLGGAVVGLCGDHNKDGVRDIADVIYFISYLFLGTSPPDPPCSGDNNCDGVVDSGDLLHLINYLFLGTSPPCLECCESGEKTGQGPNQKIDRTE
jgi:hypothetical protein